MYYGHCSPAKRSYDVAQTVPGAPPFAAGNPDASWPHYEPLPGDAYTLPPSSAPPHPVEGGTVSTLIKRGFFVITLPLVSRRPRLYKRVLLLLSFRFQCHSLVWQWWHPFAGSTGPVCSMRSYKVIRHHQNSHVTITHTWDLLSKYSAVGCPILLINPYRTVKIDAATSVWRGGDVIKRQIMSQGTYLRMDYDQFLGEESCRHAHPQY